MFVCVPDTEAISLVGSGLVTLVAAQCVRRSAAVPPGAQAAAGVMVIAAAAVGATGRPPAMAGALGAVSLCVTGPLLEKVLRRSGSDVRLAAVPATVVVGACAAASGRIAGVGRAGPEAILLAVVVSLIALIAWAAGLGVPGLRMRVDQASASRRS